MTQSKKPLAFALGAAFLASSVVPMTSAEANPFAAEQLNTGYNLANYGAHGEGDHEGKCGEGKCGEKDKEGKCGEGKCGEEKDRAAKDKEGKCGEGKCGEKDADTKAGEGKCGEGKCGGA